MDFPIILEMDTRLSFTVWKIMNTLQSRSSTDITQARTEGAPITDLALKMLEQIRRNEENDHGVIYFSTNVKGEPLKSTTIPVKGEKDRIIGLLCINFI